VMNVKLTPHAAELLEALRAQRQEPAERILEQALDVLVREENNKVQGTASRANRRKAVREMLQFLKQNRVHLGTGISVKDLIHEGHRV
jgi:DNA-binding MarR family transcriptional regulator